MEGSETLRPPITPLAPQIVATPNAQKKAAAENHIEYMLCN